MTEHGAREHRFFFVHVMKTGGTSFKRHLLGQFAIDEIYPSARLDWRREGDVEAYVAAERLLAISPERLAGLEICTGHVPYVVSEMMGVEFATIALLRDPVARTVSVLKHFKRLHNRYRDMPLEEIYDDAVVFRHFVENHQTKLFSLTERDPLGAFASAIGYDDLHAALGDSSVDIFGYAGDEPRTEGLIARERDAARQRALDPGSTIEVDADRLELAMQNVAKIDVLGFDDAYAAFVEELRERFGWWPAGLDLGTRENVSSEPWSAGAGLRRRIASDNAADIELYEEARQSLPTRRGH